MKLSRLLSVFLLAAVGFASCVETDNDAPAPAAQTVTITSSINVSNYVSGYGYIASDFERYILCYNRSGHLTDELKYSGSSFQLPAGVYAVALRFDIYGKPRNIAATENMLIARLTFERVSLSDISDGVLQATVDNVSSVEYVADEYYSMDSSFSIDSASLLRDYGYMIIETKQQWNFLDDDGNRSEELPKAVSAAFSQPYFECYGYRLKSGDYTKVHVLTIFFEKKPSKYYSDTSRRVTLADPHEVEFYVPRNYVLNVNTSIGSIVSELMTVHGYNVYSTAIYARYITADGVVESQIPVTTSMSTTLPYVQYYAEVKGYPKNGQIVSEDVLVIEFGKLKSEELSGENPFVLDAAPYQVSYIAPRNYMLKINTSIGGLINDLLAEKGYSLYQTKYMLRFYDKAGTLKGECALSSTTGTTEPFTEVYVEVFAYPKGGKIENKKAMSLTFGPFNSADISTAENGFAITGQTPYKVEYFVE